MGAGLRLEELARSMEPGARVSRRRAQAGGAGSQHGARSAGQWVQGSGWRQEGAVYVVCLLSAGFDSDR